MFWDITAGVYDLFAYGLNRKVDMELRKKVCEFITEEDTERRRSEGALSEDHRIRTKTLFPKDDL